MKKLTILAIVIATFSACTTPGGDSSTTSDSTAVAVDTAKCDTTVCDTAKCDTLKVDTLAK